MQQSDPLRRAHPYVCPAGYWTIGWGHLCPPDHPPVTEAEAESYLAADMAAALAATLRYCPVLINQPENRLAAIVDFTFNLGAGRLQTSTLRRRINQTDWARCRAGAAQMGAWRRPSVAWLGGATAGGNCSDGSVELTSTRSTNSYDAMNTSLSRHLNFPPCTPSSPPPFAATATSVA